MRVAICGGGVIGAATAYFLARRGADVLVIERSGIACAASGNSGGFLARDWCDGTPVQDLARRSFDLHAELAGTIADDWGYRRLTTYGGVATGRAPYLPVAAPPGCEWVSDGVRIGQRLGTSETTAQVHPARFTQALLAAAEAAGARLRLGEVTGIARNGSRVTGVEIGAETLTANAVVIAMGPWSLLAAAWLPLPPVFGLKGHSLVFETGTAVPPTALFLECRDPTGIMQTPEIFPRADGTTYVCAISSESPLPLDPADIAPDDGAIERLEAMCRDLSPVLAAAPILARQACYRPIARDGLPLIGRVPGVAGAYIATGHSVWGILNAPATGEAIAELILDGTARQIDLARFDPGRLSPLDPGRLRRAVRSPAAQ